MPKVQDVRGYVFTRENVGQTIVMTGYVKIPMAAPPKSNFFYLFYGNTSC